jgi:exopolysaccharide biosynthesis polyprenyl glycosylphosphotransferase
MQSTGQRSWSGSYLLGEKGLLRRYGVSIGLFIGDLLLTLAALFCSAWWRPYLPLGHYVPPDRATPAWQVYLLVGLIWAGVFLILGVYDTARHHRVVDELQTVTVSVGLAGLVFAGALYFSFREISRLQALLFITLDWSLLLGFRLVARALLRLFRPAVGARRVLVVGAGPVGQDAAGMIQQYAWAGLELVGFLDDKVPESPQDPPILGRLEQAVQVVESQRVDEVVVALPLRAHRRLVETVLALQRTRASVRVVPDFFDLAFVRASLEDFGGMPLIGLREPALDPFQRAVKRALDLMLACVALLISLPIMALVALGIKLDSPGPVLFKQQRVGENGRLFWMYKFRSMVEDADAHVGDVIKTNEDGALLYKRQDDPRVTRIGRIIRRLSLDELPQFFNVLKGEMSLVGPRPELPWLVEEYEDWQCKRFAVPQGITGWWQVNGRSDKPMHLHTEEDLYYIQHYSLLLDLQILWRTLGAVLRSRGAY